MSDPATRRSNAKGYTLLYSFKGAPDGAVPYGGVIVGKKGEIFGTTYYGGSSVPPSNGAGTVFTLTKSGKSYVESVIHNFGVDGYYPSTGPTLDPSGSLYVPVQSGPPGKGASGGVVSLTPSDGAYNESGVFRFSAANGTSPGTQLVEIPDGSLRTPGLGGPIPSLFYGTVLYTTAFGGGAAGCGSIAVFSLALDYSDDYDFQGPSADGAAPVGNVAVDASRNIYGTTSAGGAGSAPGNGTVFEFNTIDNVESVLYEFQGGSGDGYFPTGGVVLDNQESIYGTTQLGGAKGHGVIFRLKNTGNGYTYSILHSFGGANDGATPYATPVLTAASNILYGTTSAGGANGAGTIYQIATNGTKYKVLYSFAKSTGASPGYGSLFLEGNSLYGTTEAGGSSGQGVVYKFIP